MNEKFHELNRGMAVQVVAQKIAEGQIDPLADSFEALVAQFQEAVIKVAENFGAKAPTTKPKRAPRKATEPKPTSTGKRPGIEPEALKGYIGGMHSEAHNLQEIADRFGVSKGVAQRAVEALPGVKSAEGTKEAGKRGVPPTVYWVE
jgi:hypothetical protein